MARIIVRYPDGNERSIDVPAGESIMHGIVAAGLSGIEAECGGALTCATCHVHLEPARVDRIAPPDFAEAELLEMVEDYQPNSRLSCQLIMEPQLDGLMVAIPSSNLR